MDKSDSLLMLVDATVSIPRQHPPVIKLCEKHSMISPERLSRIERKLSEVFSVIDNTEPYELANELIDRLGAQVEILTVSVVPDSIAGFTCLATSGYWAQYKVNGYLVTCSFNSP